VLRESKTLHFFAGVLGNSAVSEMEQLLAQVATDGAAVPGVVRHDGEK
jgi:hypothetical protein